MATSFRRRARRAIVIGGSIAGLFTAAFLRRIGWEVDVYERSSVELVGRGVGIFATHPELLEALDQCGAGIVDIGVIAHKRITLDSSGDVIAQKPFLQLVTSWDRLRNLLFAAVDPRRYHLGHVFERVDQDGRGVRVRFTNSVMACADLLIGCDGLRSAVRTQFAHEIQPIYAGYGLWRGAPSEADLTPHTRTTIFPYFAFFLAEQTQILGYPIPGREDDLRPGRRRYNVAWFRVADADTLGDLCVDANGRRHDFSVPAPLVRPNLVARMRADAEALLPPQFAECLRQIAQPFFTPVCDFCSASLAFGRVALVGDAASTARPHIGFGVAKAGAEAQALAAALRDHDDVDRALAGYNAARQPLSERIVRHGRRLGTQLGVDLKTDDDRRMAKLLQSPNAILDWIGVPNFLAT